MASAVVLVSNTGKTTQGHRDVGVRDYAQPFETGTNTNGYDLESIVLSFGSAPTETGTLTVEVREESTDSPSSTTLYTLTNPATISSGLNEFSAPSGATLTASTTYWVVASYSVDSGPTWNRVLLSDGVDADAATGWDIDTAYSLSTRGTNNWSTTVSARAFKIQVKGTVKAADTTPPTVSSAAVVGDTLVITFNENLAAADNLTNGAFEVSKGSTNTVVALSSASGDEPEIDGATVTLTLANAMVHSDTDVKVDYDKPGSGSDNTLEDAAGNEVASFTDQAVTNNTANQPPTSADAAVSTAEDTALTIATSSFAFNDADGSDTLASVRITGLETAGELELDGTDVSLNQVISKADLDAGRLVFKPATDANGSPYATFRFKVSDGKGDSAAAYTMTINVTALDDAPGGQPTITGATAVGLVLRANTTGIRDPDGLSSPGWSYQWVRQDDSGGTGAADISGATGSTYTLVEDDLDKYISVRVGFTDDGGTIEGPIESDTVGPVTVYSTDPVQQTWLSRFGSIMGSQVVDAVSGRLAAPSRSGAEVKLGGQSFNLARMDDEATLAETVLGLARALDGGPEREPVVDHGLFGSRAWHQRGIGALDNPRGNGVSSQGLSAQELLLGSAFYLSNDDGDGGLTAWSWLSTDRFDRQDATRMDGKVTTAMVGADTSRANWLAGVAVSLSEGQGKYAYPGNAAGSFESKLNGVHPYLRVELDERVQVWGLLGFGSGDMTLHPQGEDPVQTGIRLRLGAVGAEGMLQKADEPGGLGLDLALKADVFAVKTKWDGISNETDTSADGSRLRVAIEGAHRVLRDDGTSLTSALELGLRYDGGDAETGTGLEIGGRMGWSDPVSGLSVEASARVLLAHRDDSYSEWGARGSLRLKPGRSGRGLSFSLTPELGAAASRMDNLWSLRDANELAPGGDESESKYRINGEIGYGVPAFGDFTGTPYLGLGLADAEREWHLGWRLIPAGSPHDFSFEIDAARREPDDRDAEHGITLNSLLRW